ncbi:hypothetical protein IFM89_017769 [Coptis chinensis]|uniref:Uncharacterized protein n=1 Tax=Coptis chinensis TaxID=261450 RepID=A0A835I0U4_9MAGN|nr:hypothetical protein IFM89_017769 [Coptis chinensis]
MNFDKQFIPRSSSEVLITSADSRIRVVDGVDLVHKFKGFSNTSSQISASVTSNGKHVVCASGDSYVYVWNHEGDSRPSRSKGVTVTSSYEHFHCQDVSVAIPWPGVGGNEGILDSCKWEYNGFGNLQDEVPGAQNTPLMVEESNGHASPMHGVLSNVNSGYLFDKMSATWHEEKLLQATQCRRSQGSFDFSNEIKQGRSAWGMVIVTAGLRGEIKTFQNYGLPFAGPTLKANGWGSIKLAKRWFRVQSE